MKKSHIKILSVVLVSLTFLLFSCSQQAETPVSLSINLDPSFVTSVLQPLSNTHTEIDANNKLQYIPYLRCKVTGAVYQAIEIPLTNFSDSMSPIKVEFDPIGVGKRIRFEVELIDAVDVVYYAASTEIFSIQPNLPPQKVTLKLNAPIILWEAGEFSINKIYLANDVEDLSNGKMMKTNLENVQFSDIPNTFAMILDDKKTLRVGIAGNRSCTLSTFSSSNYVKDGGSGVFPGYDQEPYYPFGGLDYATGKTWYTSVSSTSGDSYSLVYNGQTIVLGLSDLQNILNFVYVDDGFAYFGLIDNANANVTFYVFKQKIEKGMCLYFIDDGFNPDSASDALVSIDCKTGMYINDLCVRDGVVYILKAEKNSVSVGAPTGASYRLVSSRGALLAYDAKSGALIKSYGLADMPVLASDVEHLSFPLKIVAIKPQKLVIADGGFDNAKVTDSIGSCSSNVNRVFSFDLERKILEHEADLGFPLCFTGSGSYALFFE